MKGATSWIQAMLQTFSQNSLPNNSIILVAPMEIIPVELRLTTRVRLWINIIIDEKIDIVWWNEI